MRTSIQGLKIIKFINIEVGIYCHNIIILL